MFKVSDTIRRTETVDGGILLDIHHGQMFCLNIVGAKILELVQRLLWPNHFRKGCSSLFQKFDGTARITEELFRAGNRLVGNALSYQKHTWLDAPAGGGHRIQKVRLV